MQIEVTGLEIIILARQINILKKIISKRLNGCDYNYILFNTNNIRDSITCEGFSEYKLLIRLAKIAFKDIAL